MRGISDPAYVLRRRTDAATVAAVDTSSPIPASRLDTVVGAASPRAVVLVLHGGQQSSFEPVRDRHASWWRMAWLARSMARWSRREGLSVLLLQNAVRGWNDPQDPSPVRDARRAIEQVAAAHPGVPVVLVGHSMGGRTACRVADGVGVVGVVLLAPWLPDGEPTSALRDRHLHVLHGTADRWTSPAASKAFVERARSKARAATWEAMPGAGHFMFRRVRRWTEFVEDSVRRILDDVDPPSESSTQGRA